jgi:hypothetical protein
LGFSFSFHAEIHQSRRHSDCVRVRTHQDDRKRSIVYFAMRVRIARVPPTQVLEGIDLRPFQFRKGKVYELEPQVGKMLMVWGYAQRAGVVAQGKKRDK